MSQREEECFEGRRREGRDWFGLVEFGFFLILIGSIFLVTPNFFNRAENFFKDFETREIYPNVFLPAPKSEHPGAYTIIMYFCLVFGLFEIVILALRFAVKSPMGKKADTVCGIVFWLGAAIFASMLVTGGSANWFPFIGGLIVSIGLAIVVRSFIALVSRPG